MWETSLPEDKLAGDLGNVIEATSIRRSSVSFFKSKKIGAGQFGTFSTASVKTRMLLGYRYVSFRRVQTLAGGFPLVKPCHSA
jgi:hypothetical protein